MISRYLSSTGCPNKQGNSVTNSISSLLWIITGIPDFLRLSIIMSARVYFMKTVNGYKDVSIMSLQDEQWRRTSLLCFVYCNFLVLLSTTVCSQNTNKQIVNIADKNLTDYSFLRRYHCTREGGPCGHKPRNILFEPSGILFEPQPKTVQKIIFKW